MLKQIIFFLVAVVIPVYSYAQTMENAEIQPAKNDVVLNQNIEKPAEAVAQADGIVDEDVLKILEEERKARPVRVPQEEVIALETEAKKSIQRGLKNKNVNDRKKMVDIFTWQERTTKIKELIKEGKTYSEAKKIADEMIKKPQINAKNNKDMEKYMYEKNGLISNKKGDTVDNEK